MTNGNYYTKTGDETVTLDRTWIIAKDILPLYYAIVGKGLLSKMVRFHLLLDLIREYERKDMNSLSSDNIANLSYLITSFVGEWLDINWAIKAYREDLVKRTDTEDIIRSETFIKENSDLNNFVKVLYETNDLYEEEILDEINDLHDVSQEKVDLGFRKELKTELKDSIEAFLNNDYVTKFRKNIETYLYDDSVRNLDKEDNNTSMHDLKNLKKSLKDLLERDALLELDPFPLTMEWMGRQRIPFNRITSFCSKIGRLE